MTAQPSERAMKVAAQQMPVEAGFAKVSRVRLAVAIDRGLPGYDELLAACKACVGAINEVVESEQPTSTGWVNARAARVLAQEAIALAEVKL